MIKQNELELANFKIQDRVKHKETVPLFLPHKVKTQYVHCRLTASYFFFPWRDPAEISRRSLLSFITKVVAIISNMRKYNF